MAADFRDTQGTQNGRAIAFSTQLPAGVKEWWGKIQPWETHILPVKYGGYDSLNFTPTITSSITCPKPHQRTRSYYTTDLCSASVF